MSQLVFFGLPTSSYVRTARMIAFEKGLEHAVEPIEVGGEINRKLHPWAKVPVLRHGDLTLLETSAIARYLEETGPGPSLLPRTAAERALMEQWISAINSYLYDSLIRQYALPHIFHKFRGAPAAPEKIAAAVPAMQRDVARLDAAYTGRSWISGESLSLADFFVAPIVQTLSMFPEGQAALAGAPELSRAYAALEQRDSFRKAHAGLFGR
jgi:glutathione S-transferase